jgi:uncharacterized membrane protein HdeD (DUF308 family)
MFRSLSRSLLWRGLLSIAIGIVAIIWPGITIASVVIIFAVAVFLDAFYQGARAFSSNKAGPLAGHLLLAILDLAAGVAAIVWPGITAIALTLFIAIWALVTGLVEFAAALAAHETAGQRAMFGFGGLLSVALGVVLFARPDVGAVSLAEVFGLFSLGYGIWSLVLAAGTHQTGSKVDSVLGSHGSHA